MQDKSSVICSEILVEHTRFAHKHDFGTSRVSIKEGMLNCRRKMESKFLADAGFQGNATVSFFARLREGSKKKTLY
jgi:hypothetical protein